MRTLVVIILWCILFTLCWPLALLALIVLPLIWLILLPFKIVGLTIELIFKFIGAILMLPLRIIRAI